MPALKGKMKPSIVWFRDDLRVADNPALRAAVDDGAAVALYVLDEESAGLRPHGGASRWWLHHSLLALRAELDKLGIPLVLRRGPAFEVVQELTTTPGAGALYWNRRYGAAERTVDAGIKAWAREAGIHVSSFQASLLHEPWNVTTKTGGQYKVFTPFWRTVSAQDFREPLPVPEAGHGYAGAMAESDDLESWSLLPTKPDWAGGLAQAWTPGAAAGHKRLARFVSEGLSNYSEGRNRPDTDGSSGLSPYLRWGELSPYEVWHALGEKRSESSSIFASELGWREFCWHQYFHNPQPGHGEPPARSLTISRGRGRAVTAVTGANPATMAPPGSSAPGKKESPDSLWLTQASGNLGHRLDAQPCTHGRGQLPGEKPRHPLASGRAMVLGHPGGRGSGVQSGELAVGSRFRGGRLPVLPDLQPGGAADEVRSPRQATSPSGSRSSATADYPEAEWWTSRPPGPEALDAYNGLPVESASPLANSCAAGPGAPRPPRVPASGVPKWSGVRQQPTCSGN